MSNPRSRNISCLILLFLPLFAGVADTNNLTIRNGVIDIHGRTDGVSLEGRWAFWPGQFIYPEIASENFDRFEQFPAVWSRYRPENFPSRGYASYAVLVRGLDPAMSYALRIPAFSSAVRCFVDGNEVYREGEPATNAKSEVPDWKTGEVLLPVTGKTYLSIVLHLSNFYDLYPAGGKGIVLGSYSAIRMDRSRDRMLLIIPFGILLAMGACFIAFYVFHHKDASSLMLGLLSFFSAFRILCSNEFIIVDLAPWLSGRMVFRLGYLTFTLAVAAFCGFVRVRYVDKKIGVFLGMTVSIAFAYSILILFAPVGIMTACFVPFQLVCVLVSLFILFLIIRSVVRKESGSRIFLVGFVFFIFFVFRDFLIVNRIVSGALLSHLGILCLVAAMSNRIFSELGSAFTSFSAVSRSLVVVNASLSRFVPDALFGFLGKSSIKDICLGDNASHELCVMFINFGVDSSVGRIELFNEVLPLISPALEHAGGFVDSYQDEGIMVLFPDDSGRAVSCALEIARIVKAAKPFAGDERPLFSTFAAGIHRGKIMIGTIGESDRMEGTVISTVVGIAKHLMKYAYARNISIAVSADVANALVPVDERLCFLVPHGEVKLGSKNLSLSVFEVRPK